MGSKDLLDKRVSISLRLPKSIREHLEFFCTNRPYHISMSEAVDRSLTFFLGSIDYTNLSSDLQTVFFAATLCLQGMSLY